MSVTTPWRRLWDQMDAAMARFGDAQAKATGEFLKDVSIAVTRYGEEVDPDSFDELGQPIEPEEDEENLLYEEEDRIPDEDEEAEG